MQTHDTSSGLESSSGSLPLLSSMEDINTFLTVWRDQLRQTSRNLLGATLAARADTSDVAQEGMLQAWKDLEKFRGSSARQFAAWVKRIARGHAAKIRRHHLAERRSAQIEVRDPHAIVDFQGDPLQQLEKRETLLLLTESLERLPAPERAVILMRIFENQTFVEIAKRIGKGESSARALFASGIRQLRGMLKGHIQDLQ